MHRKGSLNAVSRHATLLLLAGAAACGSPPPPTPPVPTDTIAVAIGDPDAEILWDTWGVPHIFARDANSLFHAFGWAQARSHGDLLLRLYGEARGRAAEYQGPLLIPVDRWVRTNAIPARARQWWSEQPPEARAWLSAFVAGINAYAQAHPDSLAEDARRVLPIQPVDVLAHVQRVLFFEFVTSQRAVDAAARVWRGGAPVPVPVPSGGSNAWAIAPSRSESGNALLLANPHLPWGGPFTWFEAQLQGAGVDAYGAALVGFPLLGIAFNDRLGWTHTVNTIDAADLYELTLTDGGYRWDRAERRFESRDEVLRVLQPDGSMNEQGFTVRSSLHGPVVAEGKAGHALALRVAGLDRSRLLTQTWQMLRASTLQEFETSLSMSQLPIFSVIYADRDGHILHASGGAVPVRPRGSWRDWAGVVRGDTSSTLWTATHPYAELPRLADPGTGFVQNANEPPWTTTLPLALRPANYPSYMAPAPAMSFRAQNSARMLFEDLSISFDELIRYKHSTRVALADHMLDDAILAARAGGSGIARRAADVLERWDRTTDAGSPGGILFQAFWRELQRTSGGNPFEVPWLLESPLGTPDGIGDPAQAAAALTAAATEVEGRYRTLEVPWGNVHRLRSHQLDLPANGGSGSLGIFRVTEYEDAGDGLRLATGGDSYIAAIEFGPVVRAMTLVAYGNSSQPGSRHRGDQLRYYSGKRLRPVWRTRPEIHANLELRESF